MPDFSSAQLLSAVYHMLQKGPHINKVWGKNSPELVVALKAFIFPWKPFLSLILLMKNFIRYTTLMAKGRTYACIELQGTDLLQCGRELSIYWAYFKCISALSGSKNQTPPHSPTTPQEEKKHPNPNPPTQIPTSVVTFK